MRRARFRVDGAARRDPWILRGPDRDIPIGREPFASGTVRPTVCSAAGEQRYATSAETAALDDRASGRMTGMRREDLYDAADGIRAVQIAAAPAQNLHAIDRCLRQFVPVDPAAESVVQRHAVGEDERPARTGSAEAAKRDALRSGIRDPGRGAAEQRESRDGLQRVIEGHRTGSKQIGCGEDRHRRRWVQLGDVGSRRGDVDGFEERRWFQCDVQVAAARRQRHGRRRESHDSDYDPHVDPHVAGSLARKLESAVGTRLDLAEALSGDFEQDVGVWERTAERVDHPAARSGR